MKATLTMYNCKNETVGSVEVSLQEFSPTYCLVMHPGPVYRVSLKSDSLDIDQRVEPMPVFVSTGDMITITQLELQNANQNIDIRIKQEPSIKEVGNQLHSLSQNCLRGVASLLTLKATKDLMLELQKKKAVLSDAAIDVINTSTSDEFLRRVCQQLTTVVGGLIVANDILTEKLNPFMEELDNVTKVIDEGRMN